MFHKPLAHRMIAQTGEQQSLMFRLFCSVLCRINVAAGPEVEVAESTVRQYVRARKTALGLLGQETYVPQSYQWGREAQVDWYEGWAEFGPDLFPREIGCGNFRNPAGCLAAPFGCR